MLLLESLLGSDVLVKSAKLPSKLNDPEPDMKDASIMSSSSAWKDLTHELDLCSASCARKSLRGFRLLAPVPADIAPDTLVK